MNYREDPIGNILDVYSHRYPLVYTEGAIWKEQGSAFMFHPSLDDKELAPVRYEGLKIR